ncbi:MAG TPA: 50S ribosomal protein L6 [Terriglobales bacterium]|nr:50S ribosomal protein L6 [Terriglobales bacterium]
MSRIGKMPIPVPASVKVTTSDGVVNIEGPKGKLQHPLPAGTSIELEGSTLHVRRQDEERGTRSVHGLTRRILSNMVSGVSTGFTRVLEINGVGYRADVRGQVIQLSLGYSHPIIFQLPSGVQAKVDKQTVITLEGFDRQLLGEVAAQIRKLRPPEPYKGKGIKYAEERLRRKAGKAAGAGG